MNSGFKTILIPINQGIAFRYFFQTDICRNLIDNKQRIVLLVPDPDDKFFKKFTQMDNIVLEKYRLDECERYQDSNIVERFLNTIRLFIQNKEYDITTTEGIYQAFLKDFEDKLEKLKTRKRVIRIIEIALIRIMVTISRKFKFYKIFI